MGQGTVLTAPLAPAASFPNSWDQMVSGNECLARRGAGTTAAGGLLEWGRGRGRGEQGMVQRLRGTASFRSEFPPCPTNPGLWMWQQNPSRRSSGHCCTPEGCQAPGPGRGQCCPGGYRSECSHLCSRVWHGQRGELWPWAPLLCLQSAGQKHPSAVRQRRALASPGSLQLQPQR